MEFLKTARRRSLLSEAIYVALNIILAVAVLVVIIVTNSIWLALAFVLLSKWRVLAVRPRYWAANIQANMVDLIVSCSFVVFLMSAVDYFPIQLVLTTLYIGWLLLLKPRSKRSLVVAQAGVALFAGVSALMIVSYTWPVSIVVLFMWLIGYATTHHVLMAYEESYRVFLSLVWGLFVAEIGWLSYHWTIAYAIPGFGGIRIPEAAVIILAISFAVERVYASYHTHQTVRSGDVLLPLLFSGSVVAILLLFFNAGNTTGF